MTASAQNEQFEYILAPKIIPQLCPYLSLGFVRHGIYRFRIIIFFFSNKNFEWLWQCDARTTEVIIPFCRHVHRENRFSYTSVCAFFSFSSTRAKSGNKKKYKKNEYACSYHYLVVSTLFMLWGWRCCWRDASCCSCSQNWFVASNIAATAITTTAATTTRTQPEQFPVMYLWTHVYGVDGFTRLNWLRFYPILSFWFWTFLLSVNCGNGIGKLVLEQPQHSN
jgi:hypothetical protein